MITFSENISGASLDRWILKGEGKGKTTIWDQVGCMTSKALCTLRQGNLEEEKSSET